jgi:hypothetical protein
MRDFSSSVTMGPGYAGEAVLKARRTLCSRALRLFNARCVVPASCRRSHRRSAGREA